MKEQIFTGAELETALKSGTLKESGTSLTGMVKSSEKEGHISFTRSGCGTWIDLPNEMIERAEHVGNSTCKDHSHPVFNILLKTSDDPYSKILAALLAQLPASPQGLDMNTMREPTYPVKPYSKFQINHHNENDLFEMNQKGFNSPIGNHFSSSSLARNNGINRGGLGFNCGARSCRCDGWGDCDDLDSTGICSSWDCHVGWLTGTFYCNCGRSLR